MKCYYPIDSAGNRIGFKTPEACVYDASGTSLTTKLAQINSNIDARYTKTDIDNKLIVSQTSFNIKNTSDITYGSDSSVLLTRYGRMCMIKVSLVMTCAMHVRSKVVDLGMNVYGTHTYGQSGGTDNTAFIYVDDTIDPDGLYIFTYDHAFENTHIRATLVSIIK